MKTSHFKSFTKIGTAGKLVNSPLIEGAAGTHQQSKTTTLLLAILLSFDRHHFKYGDWLDASPQALQLMTPPPPFPAHTLVAAQMRLKFKYHRRRFSWALKKGGHNLKSMGLKRKMMYFEYGLNFLRIENLKILPQLARLNKLYLDHARRT